MKYPGFRMGWILVFFIILSEINLAGVPALCAGNSSVPYGISSKPGWIFYINKYLQPDMGIMAISPDGITQPVIYGPYFSISSNRDGIDLIVSAPHPSVSASRALYKIKSTGDVQPVLLTPGIGWAENASFSPDGMRMVYHVYIPSGGTETDPTPTPKTGTGLQGVIPLSAIGIPFSIPPSGEYVAIARVDGSDANLGNHNAVNPGGIQIAPQIWRSPDWHPTDPNKIAVSIQHYPEPSYTAGLFITNPEGTSIQPLFSPSFVGYEHDDYPVWSPDGETLAYTRSFSFLVNGAYVGKHELCIMRGDGTDAPGKPIVPSDLVPSEIVQFGIVSPSWSPDGQWLVFSVATEGNLTPTRFDLYKVKRDGTGLMRLTNDGWGFYPAWYPRETLPTIGSGQTTPAPNPTEKTIATSTPIIAERTPTIVSLTPTNTFTPSLNPAETPHIPEPVSALQPIKIYEFDKPSLAENGWAEVPGGFTYAPAGIISTMDNLRAMIPASKDDKGLLLKVLPGQVVFIYSKEAVKTGGQPLVLRLTLRTSAPNASLALAALRGSFSNPTLLDGSIGMNFPKTTVTMVSGQYRMVLLYEPDQGDEITPVIQVAATGNLGTVSVYIDKLEILKIRQEAIKDFYSIPH